MFSNISIIHLLFQTIPLTTTLPTLLVVVVTVTVVLYTNYDCKTIYRRSYSYGSTVY